MTTSFSGHLLSGDHASRPTATTVPEGTLYSCTDHSLVYQSDGATWSTWASLAGTGSVATDTIWDNAGDLAVGSGSNTAAKLAKGAAGAYLSTYNGVVKWNGGTSFPASPATGDRWWRSDLGYEFVYDGTRWRTVQVFQMNGTTVLLPPFGTAGPYSINHYALKLPAGQTYYFTTMRCNVQLGSTNTGSHYWTLEFIVRQTDYTGASTVATTNTSADTADRNISKLVTIGTVVDPASITQGRIVLTKTGSPTSISAADFVLEYQIVAT